jgi:hypothetical protein
VLVATAEAQRWLAQFDAGRDRDAAADLLGGLALIGTNAVHRALLDRLGQLANSQASPLAMYAVREVRPSEFWPADPRRNPALLASGGGGVGSEAIIANTLTQAKRIHGSGVLLGPGIGVLRRRRCHHIALVDDYSGSGDRVVTFLKELLSNKSIRSWYSAAFLHIHVVLFAAEAEACARIRREAYGRYRAKKRKKAPRINVEPIYVQTPPSHVWLPEQMERIVATCRKYARRAPCTVPALGYGNGLGMAVLQHSCPNNVPPILWCGGRRWTPLFPNRAVPVALQSLFHTDVEAAGTLSRLGSVLPHELASAIDARNPQARKLYLMLALLRRRRLSLEHLADRMGTNSSQIVDVVQLALNAGLVASAADAVGRQLLLLTPDGRRELHSLRARTRPPTAAVPLTSDMYFPTALTLRATTRI